MSAEPRAVIDELVVLLDDDGHPIGTAPKATVHHAATPLHLAFSCWVLDGAGRTLITQRALSKITWPGVWTNTVCGHPAPDESIEAAVRRRALAELGLELVDLRPALPDFRYRAVMADGTVENEVCPVFTAGAAKIDDLVPHPSEVASTRWVALDELRDDVDLTPDVYSPWMLLQLAQLAQVG